MMNRRGEERRFDQLPPRPDGDIGVRHMKDGCHSTAETGRGSGDEHKQMDRQLPENPNVFADREATVDGLNPLTISHAAMNDLVT